MKPTPDAPDAPDERPVPGDDVAQRGTDPTLGDDRPRDRPKSEGVAGSTWVALILGALVLILLLIFVVQNGEPANFTYLGLDFSLPLGVAMLFAAVAGMLVMALFGSIRLFKLGHRLRKLEGERESIKRTLT